MHFQVPESIASDDRSRADGRNSTLAKASYRPGGDRRTDGTES